MSYARARKHNRSAKQEVEQLAAYNDGFFITREKRGKLIAIAVGTVLVIFVKGIILGWLITRHFEDEDI